MAVVNWLVNSVSRAFFAAYIPQPHHVPVGRDGAEAGDVAPLGVLAGEAAGEQVVEQGVAQASSVAAMTASAPSMASSMLSSTAAMARCSGRGGSSSWKRSNELQIKPTTTVPRYITQYDDKPRSRT